MSGISNAYKSYIMKWKNASRVWFHYTSYPIGIIKAWYFLTKTSVILRWEIEIVSSEKQHTWDAENNEVAKYVSRSSGQVSKA